MRNEGRDNGRNWEGDTRNNYWPKGQHHRLTHGHERYDRNMQHINGYSSQKNRYNHGRGFDSQTRQNSFPSQHNYQPKTNDLSPSRDQGEARRNDYPQHRFRHEERTNRQGGRWSRREYAPNPHHDSSERFHLNDFSTDFAEPNYSEDAIKYSETGRFVKDWDDRNRNTDDYDDYMRSRDRR